ncbi:esterase/lipase family protein [Paraburkholderia terrae]
MTGIWVRQAAVEPALVFVHGVLSSGETCWRNETSGAYWPDLVATADPTNSPCVYVVTYRTEMSSKTYSVNDAAKAVFEELKLDEVLSHDSIIFVCHSMGGIVVRRMLVQQIDKFAGKQLGLMLVASPSMGSSYANWIRPIARFFGHAQAEVMCMGEDNHWLMSLDDDFLELLDKHDIAGRELYEDLSSFRSGLLSLGPIVSPLSARRYFRDSLKIPGTDHFTIAKPENNKALQHRVLMEFIRQRQQARIQEVATAGSDGPSATTGSPKSSAAELLTHENLADYLFAADESALARLVASVPPEAGSRQPS